MTASNSWRDHLVIKEEKERTAAYEHGMDTDTYRRFRQAVRYLLNSENDDSFTFDINTHLDSIGFDLDGLQSGVAELLSMVFAKCQEGHGQVKMLEVAQILHDVGFPDETMKITLLVFCAGYQLGKNSEQESAIDFALAHREGSTD